MDIDLSDGEGLLRVESQPASDRVCPGTFDWCAVDRYADREKSLALVS